MRVYKIEVKSNGRTMYLKELCKHTAVAILTSDLDSAWCSDSESNARRFASVIFNTTDVSEVKLIKIKGGI